ncbi:Protein-tyrosine-phosphatase [Plesiocystis pacifica SIR-1]|uniref:protein-tyrosine-phosphatase n=1 Tax=Plesiocystis pacifica SIR-1 TaxID=391625 RepID=A6GJ63_9BACT|nr:low molecular weight protein-tyrosine-phosphatase [Plesiocystis pacifica]EDM74101.1 Protein-tyrosine-phosphatase [Plesiocystis pacifica SIR-1]
MSRAGSGSVSVCFVCLGNICRSPTAEGVFLALVEEAGLGGAIAVDSSGTGAWHAGERADPRSREEARRRGFELPSIARQAVVEDFERFDLLLAMDRRNQADLLALAPDEAARAKVVLFRSFDPEAPAGASVPDPYYGGEDGFSEVFDICARGSAGLLAHLREEYGL